MAKRRQLADGADPNKTATLLDLLENKRLISRTQCDAGQYFGRLRRTIYGRTHVSTSDPNHVRGYGPGKDRTDWEQLEMRYRRVCGALGECGLLVRELTEALCLYNRCDVQMRGSGSNTGGHLALLRRGLDAIARVQAPGRPDSGPSACRNT